MAIPTGRRSTIRVQPGMGGFVTVPVRPLYDTPPHPGPIVPGSVDCVGPRANPFYDTAAKHAPVFFRNTPGDFRVIPASDPVDGVATHAAWVAEVCANGGGFADYNLRLTVPEWEHCPQHDCKNRGVIRKGKVIVDLVTPTVITPDMTFEFYTDPGTGFMHPYAGNLVVGGTGFPVCKSCCTCEPQTEALVEFDFTSHTCP